MKRYIVAAFAALALVGCRSGVDLPVKYSEVFGSPQIKSSTLFLEVPSCKEYNSEMESSSVLQAKQKVGYLFPEAKYLGCKMQNFESLVYFEIPFQVGGVGLKDCKKNQICVASSQNNLNMNVFVGEDIRRKLSELRKGMTMFDPNNFEIIINFDNDTGAALPVNIPSLFVRSSSGEKNAVHFARGGRINSGSLDLILSNVAASQALKGRGVATAVEFPEREFRQLEQLEKK